MFGIDSSELLIVAVAALIFIGPKDLPRVMMTVGRWVGRARGYARHFTAGIENIVREAELEEMEKKWRDENAHIMTQFPSTAIYPEPFAQPAPTAPLAISDAAPPPPDEPSLPLDLPPPRELP
jgi:sec-independent protein translocase protein TatB